MKLIKKVFSKIKRKKRVFKVMQFGEGRITPVAVFYSKKNAKIFLDELDKNTVGIQDVFYRIKEVEI